MPADIPALRTPQPAGDRPGSGRRPLWAAYLAAVAAGLAVVAAALIDALGEAPKVTTAGLAAYGAFGALCAWLLTRITYFRRVSPATRALALLWGSFASAGLALVANNAIVGRFLARGQTSGWELLPPFTEEPVKTLGVVVVLLLATPRPRTALDGMVVGSFVGLGFEIVENVLRSVNHALSPYAPGQRDALGSLATDVVHEVLRSSWTGHIVITGIAGFGIGYAMTAGGRPALRRWSVAVALIMLALGGHVLWNSHRFGLFYVVGQFGLLLVFLWLIRIGRARESALYLPYLTLVEPSVVSGDERAAMRSGRSRRSDRATRGTTRRHQRATADLAVALAEGTTAQIRRRFEALGADR